MPSVQLNFTLRTTPTVRSLHLVGSWDNYASQLPMSQDPNKKKSSGAWVGTFKFQPGTLQPGSRYWYYYIMDGYHVTHDPARECIVEPTTQRKLNVLDIPASKTSSSTSTSSSRQSKRSSRRMSTEIPKGRSLSPSKIVSPRPYRPGQTSSIANETYNKASLQEITARLGRTQLDSDDSDSDSDSDDDSDVPSLTSRSSNSSSPSSVSSASSSDSVCTCERYGITRAGNRVKLDCGGSVCGSSDEDCSSDEEVEAYHAKATRRHGVVGIRA